VDVGAGTSKVRRSDATLARALVTGDPGASRKAWQRFAPLVRHHVERVLGPVADVDDVVQDVFSCFYDRVMTLQDPCALEPFMMSITRNLLLTELRRRRARRILVLTEQAPITPVFADFEAREALFRLYEVLAGLRARDRSAFLLRHVEHMELTEVATALDTSISTVKRRLARTWHKVAVQAERDPALSHYLNRSRRRHAKADC